MEILFECKTFYHLINIINIKINLLQDEQADIILTADTNFFPIYEKLRDTNLFRNIFLLNKCGSVYGRQFSQMSLHEKRKILKHPESFIESIELKNKYSHYYLGLGDDYSKLFYYYLVKNGMRPQIHLFDEGMGSYALSYEKHNKSDTIDHSFYGNRSFHLNIVELLLYEPCLYGGKSPTFPINQLPKLNKQDHGIKELYNSIFGTEVIPNQKYIFFEGGSFGDGAPSQGIELLDEIASYIGKENIAVKLHPRTKANRFSMRGYNVIGQSNIPWEIALMNNDLSDKIFLSNVSTASLSSALLFDELVSSINLFNLLPFDNSLYVRQRNFKDSYDKIIEKYNSEYLSVFQPRSMEELKEIILYVNGRKKIGYK